jgi:copper transport protein
VRPATTGPGSPPARRRLGAVLALLAVAATAVLAAAGPADAHAVLESTDPPAGGVLLTPPTAVKVTFDEAVGARDGDVRVYDSSGKRVDRGTVTHLDGGRTLQVGLRDAAAGGYAVTWRVISADSHPVSGAVTWRVGESGAAVGAPLLNRLLGATRGSTAVSGALAAQRALLFGALIVLIGGLAFVVVLWPEGVADRRWRATATGAIGLAAVASVAGVGLQAANEAGLGLGSVLHGAPLGDVVRGDYGQAAVGRLVLLAALAVVLARLGRPGAGPEAGLAGPDLGRAGADLDPGRPGATTTLAPVAPAPPGTAAGGGPAAPVRLPPAATAGLAVLAVLLAGSLGYAGHPRTGRWLAIALPVDVVHVLAASTWIGGLVVLVAVAIPRLDPAATRRVVARFSPLAFGCVAVLVASGTAQGFRQLDGWRALRSTDYGHLLLVKVVVTAVIVTIGASSRSLVRVGWVDDTADEAAWSRHLVRRSIAAETLLAAVVIVVTSLLSASDPHALTAATAYSASKVDGPVIVDAVVAPARPGPVSVHLYVSDPNATLTDRFEATAQIELPGKVAPVDLPLADAGGRHWIADRVEAPIAGRWRLTVRVTVGGLDEHLLVFDVPIG